MDLKTMFKRAKRAINVFDHDENSDYVYSQPIYVSSDRPDKNYRTSYYGDRTIITSIYNRISMDVCAIDIRHVRTDEYGRYLEDIDSGLNNCLSLEANLDQTSRSFIQDIVLSMLDEGCIAVVPVDTENNDILSMRVGKIIKWYPDRITVNLYDERDGEKKDITVLKRNAAIIECPLYSIVNGPNSTLNRLLKKMSLLDYLDDRNSSGKLNMIIQLPYVVKSKVQEERAAKRRTDLENQLQDSKYGVAYVDATEKIVQLNRPLDNNLESQVKDLTESVYTELGLTKEIMNGSADEAMMLNYYNRTVEPIISAITDEFRRKFLTKTARTQHQSIQFFRDPFRLVPVSQLAEIADKMTRNEIMSSNEIRQVVGMAPSQDPNADVLRNKNLSAPKDDAIPHEVSALPEESNGENQNGFSDGLEDEGVWDFTQ